MTAPDDPASISRPASPTASDAAAERPRARTNPLLALARLLALVLVAAVHVVALQLCLLLTRNQAKRLRVAVAFTNSWGRWLRAIVGYRVAVHGRPPESGALIAPNHYGYCDIVALASVAPVFFVAKSEVADAPFIGWMVRSSLQPVVTRRRHKSMLDTAGQIIERLDNGIDVCVFLEGTSSGGDGVLPFRSSFLQPAIAAEAPIVPVAVTWSAARPGVDVAEDIAYWKDHEMAPHLWRHLGLRGKQVDIRFGAPIPSTGRQRRELSEEVRAGVLALRGAGNTRRENFEKV